MLARCHNPRNKSFHRYGGRGIDVCSEWRESFAKFFADVGPRPTSGHSLDRVDVDGAYEPGNVRWATAKQQQRNRSNNLRVVAGGAEVLLKEACEQRGLPYNTVWQRINKLGWGIDAALSTAVR